MIPALEPFRPQIEALCRKHRVSRLEVLGSVLQASSLDECGDVDLLIDFGPAASPDLLGDYFELKFAFEALLGRSVDLVQPGAIRNPYFRQAVDQSRALLYAA
jgi:predicted nucleotidyltransferase